MTLPPPPPPPNIAIISVVDADAGLGAAWRGAGSPPAGTGVEVAAVVAAVAELDVGPLGDAKRASTALLVVAAPPSEEVSAAVGAGPPLKALKGEGVEAVGPAGEAKAEEAKEEDEVDGGEARGMKGEAEEAAGMDKEEAGTEGRAAEAAGRSHASSHGLLDVAAVREAAARATEMSSDMHCPNCHPTFERVLLELLGT